MRLLALILACASTVACASGPTSCDTAQKPAILLTVRDARTGGFIGAGVTVLASRQGGETDTIINPSGADDAQPISVEDLPGSYDLVVRRDGYLAWSRTGVLVLSTNRGCSPATVDVQASLEPSS